MRILSSAIAMLLIGAAPLLAAPAAGAPLNEYPTAARAEYVFACLKVNGETQEALEKCSCSIDIIASVIPYERYVTAEAFLSMGQVPGEKGVIFRASEQAKSATGELRRAQAEAEIRCF